MRKIFMLYMPPGNAEAMVHYEDTIRNGVERRRIEPHVDGRTRDSLNAFFGNDRIAVWGSRAGPQNLARFNSMSEGDEVLIVEGPVVRLLGRVAAKVRSQPLARELWKNLHDPEGADWELVYFIANPKEIDVPFDAVQRLLGYEPFQLRGFSSVSEEKLAAFYRKFDELYSVLLALKDGLPVRELPTDVKPPTSESPAPEEAEDLPAESEHLLMQWTLLRMGRQAGERVWAPRGDQGRIAAKYAFKEFEPTFAAGLDTQVTYLENIDVVWKAQFRIDAAFEVENSTSIYSGLLRFADLTMVAPNTRYPLFIVAPEERRERVRSQLARPSFQHLGVADRVRFLSYEKVKEIDRFVGPEGQGLPVKFLESKAESLA